VIQATSDPKLSVITAGSLQRPPANLIASDQMKRAVAELRARTPDGIVIFDAPPVAPTPEPLSLSVVVDGVILVVRAEDTTRGVIDRAMRALPAEKLLGCVVNCVQLGRDERGYYGHYYEPAVAAGPPQPAS
jgi:protein-tyrosine kinase